MEVKSNFWYLYKYLPNRYKSIFTTVSYLYGRQGRNDNHENASKSMKGSSKLPVFNALSAAMACESTSEHKTCSEVGRVSGDCLPTVCKQPMSVTILYEKQEYMCNA